MKLIITLILFLTTNAVTAQKVYITPSGAKYHTAICKMVNNTATKLDVSDAILKGYAPCKICKPVTTAIPISGKVGKGTSNSTRCNRITKAGTRCKHKTSIGNGLCYQHQPK
jgi:hypothetical protein